MPFVAPLPFLPPRRSRPHPTACTTPPLPPHRARPLPPPHPDTLSNHTLLKPHQERTLLLQIRALQTINAAQAHLSRPHPPTPAQLAAHLGLTPAQLRQQTHAGLRARNDLVAANLRLVVRVATQVHSRLSRQTPHGIPLEDLVQEGCVALIRAAERYDMDSRARFSTFAWAVVHNACLREAPRGSIVSIPERLRYARRRRTATVPVHLLKAAEPHLRGTLALDAPAGGDTSFVELVKGDSSPEEELQRELVEREVRTACYRSLSERYADVLIMRFGLNGSPPMAGKDIAKLYGVSEPRIAQIVLAALEKLRKMEPDLAQYIYDL